MMYKKIRCQMAKDQYVPIFGVYVDGADKDSNLPTGLARSRTIKWEWQKIYDKINDMMNEKKNKDK